MDNDDAVQNAETQQLPWCDECEAYAVPTIEGNCGSCGQPTTLREVPE